MTDQHCRGVHELQGRHGLGKERDTNSIGIVNFSGFTYKQWAFISQKIDGQTRSVIESQDSGGRIASW